MANLEEKEKWETGIYQIEENDPVHGGADGITNKPIKQLANRTKYLKKEVERRYLERSATTAQTGTVKLNSSDNSDSETEAATPKVVKKLKGLIDALTRNLGNYIPNSKKSNAINSASSDTVATSNAVKQVSDKIDAFNPISRRDVNLDEQTSPIFFNNPATSAKPLPTAGDFGGIVVGTNFDATQLLMEAGKIWVRGSDNNPISSPEHWSDWYSVITDKDFAVRSLTASDNLNDITVKGIYNNSTYRNTPNNNYPEEISGVLIVLSNTEQVYFASNGKMFKRFKSNNNWANGWVRLDNLATPIGADQNLDEITTGGNYYIVGLSKATLAKNYPVERSDGALEVFGNGYFQRFTTFHTKQIFTRRKIAGNWTAWVQSMTELGGTFTGNVAVPNLTATGTLQSNYRLVIDRNEPNYMPYISMLNRAVELNSDVPNKDFSCINFNASKNGADVTKVRIVASIKQDKSTALNLVTTNSRDQYSGNLTLFGQTGNVAVGKTTDNGTEKLQVAGTIGALGYINITGNSWERLRATLPDGGYWRWEVNPASATDPRFNYVYRSASGEQRYLAFPMLAKNETVAYQSWVIDSTVKKDWLVGVPIPWMLSSVPAGFLAMQGQAFDQSRYPILAQRYPSGRLPDLRGEFIRGWDNGRGVDSGRSLLSNQGDAIRNITGYGRMFTAEGNNTSSGAINVSTHTGSGRAAGSGGRGLQFDFDASRVVPTASENRPRNIAFQYICLAG
ncbi:tail fiber protein [Avibacterium endocarditidis]|uniref:tail fiber protein n=1 Tax=Avibacterium endocarditidis TaxID=380674 RepID=UPI003BF7ADB2